MVNYGGLLQNFALQQVLKSQGYEVETIDQGERKWFVEKYQILKNWIAFFLLPHKYPKPEIKYTPTKQEMAIIKKNTEGFINKYISRNIVIHSHKDIVKFANQKMFDVYIVGSDQCWRPCINKYLFDMFLAFAQHIKDIKRIAYAASFGTDQWEFNSLQEEKCIPLARLFDLVTVRESSGVDLCKKYLGVNAVQVLDPTMLLDKDCYERLVSDNHTQSSEGLLFHYILDPNKEKMELVDAVAKKTRYAAFTTMPKYRAEYRSKKDVKQHIEDCVYPPVTQWLKSFMDAKMVIVDSFHGAVFSIIFQKPFWVVKNDTRGNARFDSLLGLFQLKDRLVCPSDLNRINWMEPVNWSLVNKILAEEKARCTSVLLNSLS